MLPISVVWGLVFLIGIGLVVWGAEAFAEHLSRASVVLGVSGFALALLLAGAEPEELATVVAASLKGAPGIALGDVAGANATGCLVALGIGALIAPMPFRGAIRRYALLGLPVSALGTWMAWNGTVSRIEGFVLVGLYLLYIGIIWAFERRPPALGETGQLAEARAMIATDRSPTAVRDLLVVVAGTAAMAGGGWLLVEALTRLAGIQATQVKLGLTLVGFATGFELVILAWSGARRGVPEAAVAGVVGSFTYNMTMTLGAGALVSPLTITDAAALHGPFIAMQAGLALPLLMSIPHGHLSRVAGALLLAAYGGFLALALRI